MLSNVVNHVVAMSDSAPAVTGSLDTVTTGITTTMNLAGKMLDVIISNPIYLIFFSVSIIGAVLSVFRMVKRSSGSR